MGRSYWGRFMRELGSRRDYQNLQLARGLALAVDLRDPFSRGHSERVASLAREIAEEMGCSAEAAADIEWAALIHDLGKVAIPDSILLKPGPLSPAEWAIIKQHPIRSAEIISGLGTLERLVPLVRGHHEFYNGKGYPDHLKGEGIPLGARILAVADAYDALTSERPYRPQLSHEQALDVIRNGAGIQWDPTVAGAFIGVAARPEPALRI